MMMKSHFAPARGTRLLRQALAIAALLAPAAAWGGCIQAPGTCKCQDIDLACSPTEQTATFGSSGQPSVSPISLCPAPSDTVTWQLTPVFNCTASADPKIITCGGVTITAPAEPGVSTDGSKQVTFSGTPPTATSIFKVTASTASQTCSPTYSFDSNAGGWGDPHLTTVDGTHYNFQGAGEFVALRGPGMEIQTRQTPVATSSLPGADGYDNVRTCVSLYSAVAAKVGSRRVTYQPNISGVPDPSGMQLRVDGVLTPLGAEGVNLGAGARIVKPAGADGMEIDYADGTTLSVTSAYWSEQQQWYLNLTVGQTTAHEGIYGFIAKASPRPGRAGAAPREAAAPGWVPALPDGTSLGPMPDSLHQRYVDLYETFANAWRVTDATTLFDYGPGQSTASFGLAGWPRENPTSCAIPERKQAPPVDLGVAEAQCKGVLDKNNLADCIFDVSVTGHLGFADTYKVSQERQLGATETKVKGEPAVSAPGENVVFTAAVSRRGKKAGDATPTGHVQFLLDGAKVGGPEALSASGHAKWSAPSLAAGPHRVAAEFIPAKGGWGGALLASEAETEYDVAPASDLPLWLLTLLAVLLIAAAIWWFVIK